MTGKKARVRTKPEPSTEFLSVEQAAALLGAGARSVYRLIERRELRSIVINDRGDLRIRRRWLDEYAETAAQHQPA